MPLSTDDFRADFKRADLILIKQYNGFVKTLTVCEIGFTEQGFAEFAELVT